MGRISIHTSSNVFVEYPVVISEAGYNRHIFQMFLSFRSTIAQP